MLRPLVGLVLLVHGNSGWWAPANATDPPEGPWKAWARTKSPRLVEQMDTFADSMDGVRTTLLDWGWQGWDRGIWSLADGLLGDTHVRSSNHLSSSDEPSNVGKAAKAPQQQKNMSSGHRRQEHIPSAEEAAKSPKAAKG